MLRDVPRQVLSGGSCQVLSRHSRAWLNCSADIAVEETLRPPFSNFDDRSTASRISARCRSYLRDRLACFISFIEGVGADGGFVLHAKQVPAAGYIALKAVPNNNVEDMRYTIAHELAHACHLFRAADIDAAQGTNTEFTHRQREEAADKIVADDWGLHVPEGEDMKPGGLYDLVDALNVIEAENAKNKTEQED
jgi:hypothetical protein